MSFLTPSRLRAILLSQRDDDDLWAQNSGYVDIVLDDRNSEYWRAYVGQTQTPAKRIRNHVRGAMKKQPDTLHYYVIWKGCGHRSMNFLHLWTMDNMSNPFKDVFEDIEGPMFLFSNILEMSFARAFESLPIATLEMYFNKPDQPFSGLGLNILAPLMQGISATLHIRQTFALRAEKSVDPDISSWPEFRQQTREPDAIVLQWNKKLLATSWEDYIKQLGAAITRKTGFVLHIPFGMLENSWKPSSSCETWDTGIINNILEVQRGDCRLLSPFGNSKASIGILINRALIGEETDERAIPWGIRESGFNALNSLIWFWDPRCHNMRKKTEQITQAVLREHNKSFIDESNLTVILLDKSIDHYLGLQADPQIQKVEHLTYCGNLTFHIQVSLEGHGLQRIYIQSPTSFTTLFAAPGPAISRICEMFKYVAILTETKGINPYFSSTRSAIHHIIRTYCEEKKGSNKMTIETMNPIIQAWIFRKGFKEIKDLQELQKIGGGSFTTGLMLLLHTLMRMAKFVGHRPKPTANPHKRNNDPTNPVDPAAIENMIRLYKRVRGEGTANENATTASMNTAANNDKSTASDNTIKAMMNTEVIDDNAQIDDGSLGAFVSETLGPVSSQRMEDITALVSERRDEFLTRCAVEEVEWVNFETSATNLDGPLQGQESEDIEIEQNLTAIPQNNGYELIGTISEPLEPVKHSRNMIGQRNAIRQLLHSGRMYRGHWDKNRMIYQVLCTPYLANIAFLIHALRRESIPEQVLIKAYIDPGQAHPHRWATLSVPGDPGARLAFSLTMDGCTTWLSSEKVGAIRKANTFADFAMDVPIQEIATRPRRHLNVQDMGLLRACGVQELGTYFTDDKCELVRSEMSQKKPRKNVAE